MEDVPVPNAQVLFGISNLIPRPDTRHIVESGIRDSIINDYVSINSSLDGSLQERYCEFIVSESNALIDLRNIDFELKGRILQRDNNPIATDQEICLANNTLHSIIKSVNIHLNNTQVENQQGYAINSMIKVLTSFDPALIKSTGSLFGLRSPEFNPESLSATSLTNIPDDLRSEYAEIKEGGFSFRSPLLIDISSVKSYLINGVSLRIRLELNSDNFVLGLNENHKLQIDSAKIYVKKYFLRDNIALAMETALKTKPMMYTFKKYINKSYIIPSNQTNIHIENPFLSVIPKKVYLGILDMKAFNGDYTKNPLYFKHANMSHIQISVNNNIRYNLHSNFPHDFSSPYYEALRTLPPSSHLLTKKAFMNGNSIFCFDFAPEYGETGYICNQSGTMRLNLEFKSPYNGNLVIYLLGETDGIFQVDSERKVQLAVLG